MEECCDICGSIGVPDALVTCSRCNASLQHMYCMRARFLEYPVDWCCEECEPSSKPKFSLPANCSEVRNGAAWSSEIRKLRNESKRGPFNWEKKVATRKTEYIPVNDVIKLPSGAIDFPSCSKVTCQSSTSQPPTREEKSCFLPKNSAFDVRWTSSPVHSRSNPTREVQRPTKSRQPSQAPAKKHFQKEQPAEPILRQRKVKSMMKDATASSPGLPRVITASDTMRSSFLKLQAEKKAAKQAVAQEKTLAKWMAEEARIVAAAREAEERAAIEARGQSSKTATTLHEDITNIEVPEPSAEDMEDHIPLRRRKRKAITEPERIPVVGVEENTRSSSVPGPNSSSSTPMLLTSTLRSLEGAQMLVTAFVDVAATAKKEEKKFKFNRDLNNQLKEKLDKVAEVHHGEILGIQQRLDAVRDDYQASKVELQKAQASAEIACSQAETFRVQLDYAEARIQTLSEEVDSLKSSLKDSSAALETREKSKEEWRAEFLASSEFKEAVNSRAFAYFETGFGKCRDQYVEAGLFPGDPENFPDFDKAIASLPDEDEDK